MFDLTAFIRQLLPATLRTDLNVGFVRLLFTPIASLLLSLEATRKALLQNARSTGQVVVLEQLCNRAVYSSDVGGIYILDGNYRTVDFQVLVPAGLSVAAVGVLVGVLNTYKQAGKRYTIVEQATYATNTTPTISLAWESGFPYLNTSGLSWAINKTGSYPTVVSVDGVEVINTTLNYVAGTPVQYGNTTGVSFTVSVGSLTTSFTRTVASSHILAVTYQRSGQSLNALVQVDTGDVEVRLVGRNSTSFTDTFSTAIVADTVVSSTTYNRKRTYQNVPDGDYTLQTRIVGQTATTTIDFTLSTANQPPVVVNPMPDQTGRVGDYFTYSIPGNTFNDPDGYIANFNTTGLPAGITHSPGHPIAGTPTTAGTYTVRVTVTDNGGLTVYDEFQLVVQPATSTPPDSGSGSGSGGSTPTGSTMIVRANPSVLNLVAENNGSMWRVRDTANHSIDNGNTGYWFISGEPYTTSLSTEYQYYPGDEIIVYYVIADSPNVSASNWIIKGYAKVVFGTI